MRGGDGPMLKGSILVFVGRNSQKVIAALIVFAIGRSLHESGLGAWGLLVTTLTYATTLGALGIGPAHVHFRGHGRMDISQLLGNALIGAALFGVVSIGVFSALRYFLNFSLGAPLLLNVISVAFPIALLQNYLDFLWQGEDRLGIYSVLGIQRAMTLLLLVLIGLQLPDPYVGMALALGANSVLTIALSLYLVNRQYGLRPTFDFTLFSRVSRYGAHIQAGSVAQSIGYRFDYFLINGFFGKAVLGPYVLATQLAETLWILPYAMSIALLPRASTSRVEVARNVTAQSCRVVFAVSLAAGSLIFLFAEVIIRVLFKTRFLESVTPLRILLVGTVVFSLQKILANYFIGQGKAKWFFRATVLSMAVNLALNLWLLQQPHWGIKGAAVASAISYSLSTGLLAVLFIRDTGLPPSELLILNREDVTQFGLRIAQLRRRAARLRQRRATG